MLRGKELILATKPFAKEDRSKSWMYFLSTLGLFIAALIVSTYPIFWALRLAVSVFIALLLVRLFTMYHDYLHRAILHKSVVAKIIFTLFGYYTLNASSIWQRSHDYHHKHNSKLYSSSIGSFPIFTKKQFLEESKFGRMQYLFIRHPLTIICGYIFAFWYGMSLLSLFRNPDKHWDSAIAMLFHLAIGICFIVFGGWATFWYSFMIPAIISSFIGAYLFYAQHNFPSATFNNKEDWNYADAALYSTSYMKMNALMNWFTGNIGYHHVHHLNALIPFYRLPEVHKHFAEFDVVGTTSFSPIDMYRCFEMKVWDPELNRMIKLHEIKKA